MLLQLFNALFTHLHIAHDQPGGVREAGLAGYAVNLADVATLVNILVLTGVDTNLPNAFVLGRAGVLLGQRAHLAT